MYVRTYYSIYMEYGVVAVFLPLSYRFLYFPNLATLHGIIRYGCKDTYFFHNRNFILSFFFRQDEKSEE